MSTPGKRRKVAGGTGAGSSGVFDTASPSGSPRPGGGGSGVGQLANGTVLVDEATSAANEATRLLRLEISARLDAEAESLKLRTHAAIAQVQARLQAERAARLARAKEVYRRKLESAEAREQVQKWTAWRAWHQDKDQLRREMQDKNHKDAKQLAYEYRTVPFCASHSQCILFFFKG